MKAVYFFGGRRICAGRLLLVVVFCAAALAFGRCAFFTPNIPVRLELPSTHPWERGDDSFFWLLRYPGPGGEIQQLRVDGGQGQAEIRVARLPQVPITASPMGRLKPAGAFLSHTVDGRERLTGRRTLRLSWESGAAARLFLDLWEEAECRERVDPFTLSSLMRVEGEGDPYSCDIERIRSGILFASLSKRQVRKLETYECECLLPAEEWIGENPLLSGGPGEAAAEEDGYRIAFSGLYPGVHRFLSPNGPLELHIYVQQDGSCSFICDEAAVFE
jgi:hypothetical protein